MSHIWKSDETYQQVQAGDNPLEKLVKLIDWTIVKSVEFKQYDEKIKGVIMMKVMLHPQPGNGLEGFGETYHE